MHLSLVSDVTSAHALPVVLRSNTPSARPIDALNTALQHGTQDGRSAGNPETEDAPLGSASDYFPLMGRTERGCKKLACCSCSLT